MRKGIKQRYQFYKNTGVLPYKAGRIDDELMYRERMKDVARDNYENWGYESAQQAWEDQINNPTYDYRGYYSDPDLQMQQSGNSQEHWPDKYKTVQHKTFSNESIYSGKVSDKNPYGLRGGIWIGEKFQPAAWQSQLQIPHYENGREGEVETLPYDKSIDFLYKIENPRFKNVNREKGLVKFFDDGWAPTIGAGVANTSGAPSEWFDGQWHKKKDIDDFAYDYFSHGDEVIRAAYDKKYGTSEYPNPSDTLSLWPRMYMAQNRYQRGSLGGGATGRNAILSAVASGNTQNIVNTITKFTSPGDNNRMKRVLSAYPPVYEEKKSTDNFFDKIKKKIQTMALLNAPKSITE